MKEFMQQLWTTCKEMFAMGGGHMCTAFGAIVLFAKHIGISGIEHLIDVTQDPFFWQQIRLALVSIR